MKIWHLISNRWNSAISEYAISATRATQGMGSDVIVTALAGSPVEQRILALGLKSGTIEHFGPAKIPQLAAASKRINPDVIIAYGGPETTAAQFFKGRAKLVRFYGYQGGDGGPLNAWTKKMGHIRVDQVITPADIITQGLVHVMSCPVNTVSLGCDDAVYKPIEVARNPRPSLVIFGRLDPVKGHREFLPIFSHLLKTWPDQSSRPKLKIIGLPANLSAAHLMNMATTIGFSPSDLEIICERVSDVAQTLSSATVGVVSSIGSEAICRVAQEFLLCGTPVVTTGAGSLPEVFKDQSFGRVYTSHDPMMAASEISEVLKVAHQENFLSRCERAKAARSHFSLSVMREALARVLQSLLTAKPFAGL
jgi:glycosyltransferase involved in cell wall biosynthesis